MEDLILKGTEEAASSSHSILSQRHLLSHQPRSTKRQDAACPTPSLFGATHIRLALSSIGQDPLLYSACYDAVVVVVYQIYMNS